MSTYLDKSLRILLALALVTAIAYGESPRPVAANNKAVKMDFDEVVVKSMARGTGAPMESIGVIDDHRKTKSLYETRENFSEEIKKSLNEVGDSL